AGQIVTQQFERLELAALGTALHVARHAVDGTDAVVRTAGWQYAVFGLGALDADGRGLVAEDNDGWRAVQAYLTLGHAQLFRKGTEKIDMQLAIGFRHRTERIQPGDVDVEEIRGIGQIFLDNAEAGEAVARPGQHGIVVAETDGLDVLRPERDDLLI